MHPWLRCSLLASRQPVEWRKWQSASEREKKSEENSASNSIIIGIHTALVHWASENAMRQRTSVSSPIANGPNVLHKGCLHAIEEQTFFSLPPTDVMCAASFSRATNGFFFSSISIWLDDAAYFVALARYCNCSLDCECSLDRFIIWHI